MNNKIAIKYFDRKEGKLRTERVYASGFLYWSYNTRTGQWARDLIFRRKIISSLYGWLHNLRWSRRKIKSFVQKVDVNLDELERPLEDFSSFNEFFTREIDLSKRPVIFDPHICIAPVDGKVLVYPAVKPNITFRIKRSTFNLRRFLGNDGLSEQFAGGSMVISRLSLADYHHIHFPDSGVPRQAISIPGNYNAGGPYSLHTLLPFYTENHRMMTLFDSNHFGQMMIVEIGALTVGSIQQRFLPDARVTRGAKKGYFELGGSTVVLLFQKGMIELDEDLQINTQKDIETSVRFGDSIGNSPGAFSDGKKQKGGTFQ
ncbi:MAG: phosphatidylserine decarboxylase [Candidatus Aminicenantes bacterium]|nr:phosphatidylserine decarboxylase [Candidatus Aminicenantes bacterium]